MIYTLDCVLCGGVFYSEEAFPTPQLCCECLDNHLSKGKLAEAEFGNMVTRFGYATKTD